MPQSAARTGIWSYTTGRDDAKVVATERVEAGRARCVVLRYRPAENTGGRDKRAKTYLSFGVRDERGKLDPRAVVRAKDAADELANSLRTGQSTEKKADAPLTIFRGFGLATDEVSGAHPGPKGARRRYLLEASRATLADSELFGVGKTFRELKRSTVRALWRTLAYRYVRTGKGGPRATEILISDLYAVANWIKKDNEDILADNEAVVPTKWRKEMENDWERITNEKITVRRERHTREEFDKIFANLYGEGVDPRVSLLVELGAELRGGQVLQLRRSEIILDPDPEGHAPYGQFFVAGQGKKGGAHVVMTERQRSGLDKALEGFLRECEGAYRAGAIEDYYVFPQRIRDCGTAKARGTDESRPFGRQQMLRDFHELERLSGVDVVEGRGWYGLRRLAADMANDIENDTRVLNAMGGWSPGSIIRENTYQDTKRLKLAAKGAAVREKMRAPVAKDARVLGDAVVTVLADEEASND